MRASTVTAASLLESGREVTHEDLRRDCFQLRRRVPPGAVVLVRSASSLLVAATLAALDGWAAEVRLVGSADLDSPTDGATELSDDVLTSRYPIVGGTAPPAPPGPPRMTRWTLYTSGTTGVPQPVSHSLASLSRTVRGAGPATSLTWGLLYEPTRMAGVQVLLQVLASGARLVDARHDVRLSDRVAALGRGGVDALSATPTLWRLILQTSERRALQLRQVTLGGEIADQYVLDALRAAFPDARITHVFASTETAAAFSVSDGRAGFPRALLDSSQRGGRLQVRGGLLFVHSPSSSAAGPDGYAPTGDVVEDVGDRVMFRGRGSGVVNIGGVKVWPEQVEAVLRAHADVADALVTARANPLSGQILTAQVVAARPLEARALSGVLRAHCAARLAPPAVPATVRVVERLPVSAAGKAQRA